MATQLVIEEVLSTGTNQTNNSNNIDNLNKAAREEALRDNNASSYFKLCKQHGLNEYSCESANAYNKGLEEARRDALTGRYGVNYVELCQEAGINESDCEAPDLYQQGLVEIIREESSSGRLEKQVLALEKADKRKKKSASKSSAFLDDVNDYGVNVYGSFAADADSKRELLVKHFSGRFGAGKKQDIERYDDIQVGAMFRNVVDSYEERQRK